MAILIILQTGLERRLVTAGENKVRWDPFKPEKAEDREWMKGLLSQVHNNFIDLVKERRPNMDKDHKTVFTGDFFVGETAVKIGLADATVDDMKSFCRKRFGKDVVFQRCDVPSGLFGKWIRRNVGSETSIQIDDALDSIAVHEMESRFSLG